MRSLLPLAALLSMALSIPTPSDIFSRTLLRKSCPKDGTLSKPYLNPTLMVPLSKNLPNTAFGSTSVPLITPNDICTIFNLEIPPTAVGKTCTLKFLFPSLPSSSGPYLYTGGGHFTFTGYAFGSGATETTTFNHQPPPGPSPPTPPSVLSPGHAYIINVGDCGIQPGMPGLEVSGMLCSTDTTFGFVQSDDKCPIGFFVEIS